MKQFIAMILSLCLLLLMAGCRASDGAVPTDPSGAATTAPTETTVSVTELSPDEVEVTVPKGGVLTGEEESDIPIGTVGKTRLTYTGNVSSVRYVTSVAELPDHPELKGYDEAYFREHALLLVTETVSYGTVQVGIDAIRLNGDAAVVTLSHESQGDVGTTVMTTWLIWAEMEQGLDYTWAVGNPAVEPETERS